LSSCSSSSSLSSSPSSSSESSTISGCLDVFLLSAYKPEEMFASLLSNQFKIVEARPVQKVSTSIKVIHTICSQRG
jgi:hypothetical protein